MHANRDHASAPTRHSTADRLRLARPIQSARRDTGKVYLRVAGCLIAACIVAGSVIHYGRTITAFALGV